MHCVCLEVGSPKMAFLRWSENFKTRLKYWILRHISASRGMKYGTWRAKFRPTLNKNQRKACDKVARDNVSVSRFYDFWPCVLRFLKSFLMPSSVQFDRFSLFLLFKNFLYNYWTSFLVYILWCVIETFLLRFVVDFCCL